MKMQDTKDKRDEAEMQKKLIKYEEVYSIYALVENYPNKFKETLDELVISPDEGESNSDKVILKTVFLYFFELLGVSDDKELKNLVENCLSWTKEQEVDKFFKDRNIDEMINFETLQILSTEKDGSNHKKFFKRFCTIMVTNLIDMFPKRSDLVSLIIDKVCILAQSKIRLIRFGFTFIALGITKVLLNQIENMNNIILRLQS